MPFSFTTVGPPGSEVFMVSVPLCAPVALGVNTKLMVQLAPAGREVPQVLVAVLFENSGLEYVSPLMVTATVPTLLSVSGFAGLTVPNVYVAKLYVVG